MAIVLKEAISPTGANSSSTTPHPPICLGQPIDRSGIEKFIAKSTIQHDHPVSANVLYYNGMWIDSGKQRITRRTGA
jgi:hypothetical protein